MEFFKLLQTKGITINMILIVFLIGYIFLMNFTRKHKGWSFLAPMGYVPIILLVCDYIFYVKEISNYSFGVVLLAGIFFEIIPLIYSYIYEIPNGFEALTNVGKYLLIFPIMLLCLIYKLIACSIYPQFNDINELKKVWFMNVTLTLTCFVVANVKTIILGVILSYMLVQLIRTLLFKEKFRWKRTIVIFIVTLLLFYIYSFNYILFALIVIISAIIIYLTGHLIIKNLILPNYWIIEKNSKKN